MRKTLLYSLSLTLALNLWQFLGSAFQRARATFVVPTAIAATQATTAVAAKPTANLNPSSSDPSAALPVDVATVQTTLSRASLKPEFAALYLAASARSGTPWQLIAAVHVAETGQSSSTARRSSAGATGPMQFMPATYGTYALDGDGDGRSDITDVADAVMTAGRYLAAGGAARGDYRAALYHYNHSSAYVSRVMNLAAQLGLGQ